MLLKSYSLIVLVLFVFTSSLVALAESPTMNKSTLLLNGGWEFRQRMEGPGAQQAEWRPAEVPGVVHTDLLRNKLIPDPFYRDNESKLQWIEDANWEYRSSFQVTPETLKRRNIELVFDGLDAYAEVYLNGKQILTANNMFREWRVDVKSSMKVGANELLVVFPSIIKEAEKIAAQDKWRTQTKTEAKTYIRKAAYEYGWDWGPRFVTSGIWRPVKLELWDAARISELHIRQRDVHAQSAHLTAEVEIVATENTNAKITFSYVHGGKKSEVSRNVELLAGTNHIDFPIDISKPELWYPNGYGAQPIYKFDVRVKTGSHVEDERSVRTGLRSIVLRRDVDQWGRSFEFIVNGIPVFAKGADVIPFDSFPTRVTTERYRQILQSAKDANMNMVRHWGGGYYESDEFYDLCDELGIMVWQDFMFGNDWQPGTYDFKQSATREAEDQVRRLRNHPSIVLWCGNNETEPAFLWKERGKLDTETRIRMWGDYVSVFSGILARAVERLTPETPYWPSSPSADYEDTSSTYQSGDMHNWDIWHGMLPLRDYEKFFPRFMSEYGFQSFPDMRTVEKFTIPEDRTGITTPVLLIHQKNAAGNAKIREYMLRDYPEPKDFPSFLYASQVLQAEAIKIGAEHLRRNRPRTMGSLYWQLNDCWPVASWSSVDYYGHWKALQYYARRFYNDLLVSPHVENGGLAIYVVSDKTAPIAGDLRVRIMTVNGAVLSDKTMPIQVSELSSKIYVQMPLSDFLNSKDGDATELFAATELSVGGKPVSSNLMFFVPTKQVQLPAAKISRELVQSGDIYRLRLSSKELARSVYISFGDIEAKVSDNYFDLLPAESIEIEVDSKEGLQQLNAALNVISLTDAFEPNEGPNVPKAKTDVGSAGK